MGDTGESPMQDSAGNPQDALVTELNSARRLWSGRQSEAAGRIAVITSQIQDRENHKVSMWETLSGVFGCYFRSRGLNLLLALVVGVLGFIVTRRGYFLLRRYSPVHRVGKGNLTARISDILAMLAAAPVALVGVLLVFYVRGDWLILTLALILIIGAAWAGKAALPPYVEQLRILLNPPEQVVFLRLGGSMKTIPTDDFLEQNPERFSRGFRVSCNFGIDYKHQADATGSIPATLERALTEALVGDFGRQAVQSIKVEFSAAAASSLDYEILADFDGSLASKRTALHRRIQMVCLDACNAHGWEIRFTQITLDQAKP